jgi:hypothetical protein
LVVKARRGVHVSLGARDVRESGYHRWKEIAMKRSKEEKRERLLAKAAEVVDEYLAWEEGHPRPDLGEIEEIALRLRKRLGQEIAQMAVEEQEEQLPVPGPQCAKCGEEMRYKGDKGLEVESRAGALKIERGYYYCPGCRESIFPPGQAVEIA